MIEHKFIKELARRLVRYQLEEEFYDPIRVESHLMQLLIDLPGSEDRHIAGYVPLMQEVPLSLIVDSVIKFDFDEAVVAAQDIVLVPLKGYMKSGYRLGRGGGFYDKLLARPGLTTIGIGRDAGEVFFIPEKHDVRLDYIITESGVVGGKRA